MGTSDSDGKSMSQRMRETREARKLPTVSMSDEEYRQRCEEYSGICLACSYDVDECEPDTRERECPSCKEPKVYAVEELLMMGLVKFE